MLFYETTSLLITHVIILIIKTLMLLFYGDIESHYLIITSLYGCLMKLNSNFEEESQATYLYVSQKLHVNNYIDKT